CGEAPHPRIGTALDCPPRRSGRLSRRPRGLVVDWRAGVGGGSGGGRGAEVPAEQERGDLAQCGAALVKVAGATQVVHDRQGVPLVRIGEADGIRDPDTSLVLPSVLIARKVVAAGSPDTPLLDRADPSHAAHAV